MLAPQFAHQLADFNDLRGIQPHSGFIQNYHLRMADQRLCQAHALPVPLGKVAQQPVTHIANARAAHGILQLFAPLIARHALGAHHKIEVFFARHIQV